LGCALKRPALDFSASAGFAGCGVLKPANRLGFVASSVAAAELFDFSLAVDVVSLFCDAPNKLNPGELAAGGGLAREAKRLGFGVSAGALALGSGALMLLNSEGLGVSVFCSGSLRPPKGLPEVLGACSCAGAVCCPKLKVGVADPDAVGSDANGLLAGAEAGVLEVPNKFDDGAVVVVLVLGCAVELKLKKLVGAAVAGVFPVICALVPVLNKLFCGVSS
jgi:hypothetical protein